MFKLPHWNCVLCATQGSPCEFKYFNWSRKEEGSRLFTHYLLSRYETITSRSCFGKKSCTTRPTVPYGWKYIEIHWSRIVNELLYQFIWDTKCLKIVIPGIWWVGISQEKGVLIPSVNYGGGREYVLRHIGICPKLSGMFNYDWKRIPPTTISTRICPSIRKRNRSKSISRECVHV